MRVIFHPEFSPDIRRFEAQYLQISDGLAARYRSEVLQAIDAIKLSPTSAGHFLTTVAARSELRGGISGRSRFLSSMASPAKNCYSVLSSRAVPIP
jgi:hypothetical protein